MPLENSCREKRTPKAQNARDAGALREIKDKLEKRVEELTWRLDLEKKMRTDLEEAKGQEICKLQNAVQELQEKLREAQVAILKEREDVRVAIAQEVILKEREDATQNGAAENS